MDKEERFRLTGKGLTMMQEVLKKALSLGYVLSLTVVNYKALIQTLADKEDIWENTGVTERNQRLVLLALALVPPEPTNKKPEYN